MVYPSKTSVASLASSAQKAAATIRKQKKEIKLTPANKTAVELMVFDGLKRPDAAKQAGLTDHALRTALTKPHVLAYLNECQEVLRTSLRPRALHRMGELLDGKTETIQFKAAEYLDGMNRGTHTIGATNVNVQVNNNLSIETPGYVIDLTEPPANSTKQIYHLEANADNELISLDDVPDDE